MPLRSSRTIAWIAALTATALADAQPVGEPASIPLVIGLGAENVRLPGDERMGLVGGSLLFGIGDDWWLGPAVYGAATGERGGLFVGGVQVQRHWRVADRWRLLAGMYAGGGGGASAPVGGGLMLRPEIGLLHELGPVAAGLTWSHVRFPSGAISSSQLGILVTWNGEFRHLDLSGVQPAAIGRTGIGFDRMAGTLTGYDLRDETQRRIGLVGARAERQEGAWRWGIEAAAAAKGDAAGYMEILASLGHEWWLGVPSNLSPRIGLRAAVGLGGGGAVPTGGGLLAKLATGLTWPLGNGISLGAEFGGLAALDGPLRARSAQLSVAMDLEPDRSPGSMPAAAAPVRSEWSTSIQHYARAERLDGSQQDLQTIGLKLNRYLGDSFYLSAQAHSAFAGDAGAYAVGLVGAGVASAPDAGAWQFGAEALVGAAGGGGVVTGGGAIVQALAWAGWRVRPATQWRIGVGAVRSIDGSLASPLLELTWTRAFGLSGV